MRRTTQPDIAAVVRLLQRGDAGANEVVRARVGRILAFRGFGIPPQDRSDLEQRIMIDVWEAVNRPGFEADGFWGFVEVVTSRRCIDWRRARKDETTLDNVSEPVDLRTNPLQGLLRSEKIDLARAVLEQLPAACRELILLHVSRNKTYREIAEILGRSEAALRVQLHRCIQRAQRLLPRVMDSPRESRRGLDAEESQPE